MSNGNVQGMSGVGNVLEKCPGNFQGGKCPGEMSRGKCPGEMSREFPGSEMSRGNVLWEMSGVENVQRNVCREKCADTHADLEVSTCCSYD